MINITAKHRCCGCTACVSVCPTKAISMLADEEGFNYPKVDLGLCVNCGQCEEVCAFGKRQDQKPNNIIPTAYAAKHKLSKVLRQSSSGGMFTALSDIMLSADGLIYGAAFNKNMEVNHIRAKDTQTRDSMRGSKYVQSDLSGIFAQVKKDVLAQKLVLFTGTPCQTEGLKSFLGREYENLVCCDLICYGVPSPLIWAQHIQFLERIKHSKVVNYFFRTKKWGWHNNNQIVVFENRKTYHSTAYSNLFLELFYSRLIMRPSCHQCPYCNTWRPSDITIADCTGIDDILTDFGSFDGVSLVLVNTEKGKAIFQTLKPQITFQQVDLPKLMQPPLIKPSEPNQRRTQFWNNYRNQGYKYAVDRHFGRYYSLRFRIKKFLKK